MDEIKNGVAIWRLSITMASAPSYVMTKVFYVFVIKIGYSHQIAGIRNGRNKTSPLADTIERENSSEVVAKTAEKETVYVCKTQKRA